MKACKKEEKAEILDTVCTFYGDNFDQELLSLGQSSLRGQVRRLFGLIIVMPAINATSKCSFSPLRHLKNYLRTTMSQQQHNHLMILNIHKERIGNIDLKLVLNNFIAGSEHRSSIFAKY